MGKLIVFEGIDGSGKSTQYRLLCERLKNDGVEFENIVFPQYKEESSALIRMYLGGAFGSNPGDVNAYAASTFYAVDRYASYKTKWGSYYEGGGLLLSDRYTTSNAVHQGCKLPEEDRAAYFAWLDELEHGLMGLPRADLVLYMDISAENSQKRLRQRESATGTTADIHEKDAAYLAACAQCSHAAADFFGWQRIPCFDGERPRTPEEISDEIYKLVKGVI